MKGLKSGDRTRTSVLFGTFGTHKVLCVFQCFSFKLDPFIERSETLEKMGAERPGVLVTLKVSSL